MAKIHNFLRLSDFLYEFFIEISKLISKKVLQLQLWSVVAQKLINKLTVHLSKDTSVKFIYQIKKLNLKNLGLRVLKNGKAF